MFRKEGLEEIRVDIERATNIDALRGIATAMHSTTVHASEEVEQLKAELELTKKRECENMLLAWGGVCPPDWVISGDATQMAEIIRYRGDDLQTENHRLREQILRTERERDQAIDRFNVYPDDGEIWLEQGGIVSFIGNSSSKPELYAHLAGRDE